MTRYKFQTPSGSIIMEFEEGLQVTQVKTLLSQTLNRQVRSIHTAGLPSNNHSVLADHTKLRDVDCRDTIFVECEPVSDPAVAKPEDPLITEEAAATPQPCNPSIATETEPQRKSSVDTFLSEQILIPFFSIFGNMAPFCGLGQGLLPFNPVLLQPAVLKYCIHFEIEKHKINIQIFAKAAIKGDPAALEKLLELKDQLLDSTGQFLPIITFLLKSDELRIKAYDKVKEELRQIDKEKIQQFLYTAGLQNGLPTTLQSSSNSVIPIVKPEVPENISVQSVTSSVSPPSDQAKSPVVTSTSSSHVPTTKQTNNFTQASLVNASAVTSPAVAAFTALHLQQAQLLTQQLQQQRSALNLSSQMSSNYKPITSVAPTPHHQLHANSTSSHRIRRRTTIPKFAKKVMIDWYLGNGRYLTTEGRQLLASQLQLTEENVRVFFKNMRRIEKKTETTGLTLHEMMNVVDGLMSSPLDEDNLTEAESDSLSGEPFEALRQLKQEIE